MADISGIYVKSDAADKIMSLDVDPHAGLTTALCASISSGISNMLFVNKAEDGDCCSVSALTTKKEAGMLQAQSSQTVSLLPAACASTSSGSSARVEGGQHAEESEVELAYPDTSSQAEGDMINLTPTGAHGAVAFTVVPVLHPGLKLDPYTGLLSGVLTGDEQELTFKVTAWTDDDECMSCEVIFRPAPRLQQTIIVVQEPDAGFSIACEPSVSIVDEAMGRWDGQHRMERLDSEDDDLELELAIRRVAQFASSLPIVGGDIQDPRAPNKFQGVLPCESEADTAGRERAAIGQELPGCILGMPSERAV